MCPSFQVTHEEADSTRGRANALRAAMMGLLGPAGMASKDLYEVLDLCLSCHACKTECPSSVDMARLKAEFLYQYQQEHGIPLRSQIFGHIGQLSRIGARMPAISNLMLKGPGRFVLQSLGVHAARSLPSFAPETFSSAFTPVDRQHAEQARVEKDRPGVIFFHDTFLEHNHPEIGHAAITVLRALGVEPLVLKDLRCCGRPAVSKGMLDEAKKLAAHNLAVLAPYAQQGYVIAGCEPSCMAMFVDEIPDLVPGEQAEQVARATMTVEQYILQRTLEIEGAAAFKAIAPPIRYHGHCQQKSTFGVEDTLAMLSLIPGAQVELIESGCCGMAGSFGYEREHYDLSVQLAELSLAPAIRSAGEDTIICASGTSCRDQIAHTTDRHALHPIEIMAMALNSAPQSFNL